MGEPITYALKHYELDKTTAVYVRVNSSSDVSADILFKNDLGTTKMSFDRSEVDWLVFTTWPVKGMLNTAKQYGKGPLLIAMEKDDVHRILAAHLRKSIGTQLNDVNNLMKQVKEEREGTNAHSIFRTAIAKLDRCEKATGGLEYIVHADKNAVKAAFNRAHVGLLELLEADPSTQQATLDNVIGAIEQIFAIKPSAEQTESSKSEQPESSGVQQAESSGVQQAESSSVHQAESSAEQTGSCVTPTKIDGPETNKVKSVLLYYLKDNYPNILTFEAWYTLREIMECVHSDLYGFGYYMGTSDPTRDIKNKTLLNNLLFVYLQHELRYVQKILCSKCRDHDKNPAFCKNRKSMELRQDGHSIQCITDNVVDQVNYVEIIKQNIDKHDVNCMLMVLEIGTLALSSDELAKIIEKIPSIDVVTKPCYYILSQASIQKYSAVRPVHLVRNYGIQ